MHRQLSLIKRLRKQLTVTALAFALTMQMLTTETVAGDLQEYQVKAAFIFNFIAFTQWPENNDKTTDLCLYGKNNFGREIDDLQAKSVNTNTIKIIRLERLEKVDACQVLFISNSAASDLTSILNKVAGKAILTVADTPGAASEGVMINMQLIQNKIKFEVNLKSARDVQLNINSRLLQLATEVFQ